MKKPTTITGCDEQGIFTIKRPNFTPAEILIALLIFLALFSNGQTATKLQNGVYKASYTQKQHKEATDTGLKFETKDGEQFPIMKTDSAYFVIRTSKKTGKTYKQYLKIQ